MRTVNQVFCNGIWYKCLFVVLASLLSEYSWAQLNIVGENTEAPKTSIDYLNHPVSVEKVFSPYSPFSNQLEGFLPNGNMLYIPKDDFSFSCPIRIEEDRILFGIPKGYYNIVGVYSYLEEYPDITRKASWIISDYYKIKERVGFTSSSGILTFDEFKKDYRIDWNSRKDLDESEIQSRLYKYRDGTSYQQFMNDIALGKSSSLSPQMYLLEDKEGNIYYAHKEYFRYYYDMPFFMVDYVNEISKIYKGANVYVYTYYDDNTIKDFYTGSLVNVPTAIISKYNRTSAPGVYNKKGDYYPSSLSDANTIVTKKDPSKKLLCKDIVIDKNKILAVLEKDDGSSFSVPLPARFATFYFNGYEDYPFILNFLDVPDDYANNTLLISDVALSAFEKDYSAASKASAKKQQKEADEYSRQEKARRQEILAKYGNEYGRLINEHKLAMGMSPEMCVASIGFPSHYYKSQSSSGEFLVYKYFNMLLYFRDNKLVRIDEHL